MKKLVILLMAAGAMFAAEPQKGTVWPSKDGTTFVLGSPAATVTTIDEEAKDSRNVTVTVRGAAHSGWPLETRFAVFQARDRVWRWSVPAKLAGNKITIRLPHGSYLLEVAAEHHKPDRQPLNIKDADLPPREIALAPLPVVTGRVVTMKKDEQVPLAGAQIARIDGKVLASTNDQGLFRAEIDAPRPQENIVVMAPGFGNRIVPLQAVSNETDVGTIKMSAGVKLTLHVDRPESLKSKTLQVRLDEHTPKQYENTKIASHELKGGDDELTFSDLSKGEYLVVISGDGPLERLSTTVAVDAEDVSRDIRISPFQLAGSVHLGSEPLREGKVGIQNGQHTWNADLPIDAEGHFGGTMWQREDVGGWVESKATGSMPVDEHPTLSGDPAVWDIHFERRMITGRVFDETTKQPIEHSAMQLQLEAKKPPAPGRSQMSRLYSGVKIEDDGSYSILAMHDGTYDLLVRAPGHVDVKQTVEMNQDDASKIVDFPLSAGVEQSVEFVWPNGEPVRNSSLIEGVARDGFNPGAMFRTDEAGVLKVRMKRDDSRTLFIMPSQGSFAAVHLVGSAEPKPMRVVVPFPTASLTVNMVGPDQKPVPAKLLMRFNGEWVPYSVVTRLQTTFMAGPKLVLPHLPAGAYELWGVGGRQPTFSPPPAEPVRAGLSTGEQAVEIAVPK